MPGVEKPMDDANDQHTPKNGNRPIHGYQSHLRRWREKWKEATNDTIDDGNNIDRNAKATQLERTPTETIIWGC